MGRAPSACRRMRTVASVTIPNWPSEPMARPSKIVALRIEIVAAEFDDLAIHQHHLDFQDVVGRDAVFEAMRAAGVHGDVAADGAGELARRIGRIEEARVSHRVRNGEVGDARLHGRRAVVKIDVENPVHARQADHNRVTSGQRAARQRRAGAARHNLNPVLAAIFKNATHFRRGSRQYNREAAPRGRRSARRFQRPAGRLRRR